MTDEFKEFQELPDQVVLSGLRNVELARFNDLARVLTKMGVSVDPVTPVTIIESNHDLEPVPDKPIITADDEILPAVDSYLPLHVDTSIAIPALEINGTLTTREREVLDKLSHGLSSKETAQALGIGLYSVRKHRKHIHSKFGTHKIVDAVIIGFNRGLLTVDISDTSDRDTPELTEIETEEIRLAAMGLGAFASGHERGVSEATIRKNRERAFKKIGALTTEHVVRRAIEAGIIENPGPSAEDQILNGTVKSEGSLGMLEEALEQYKLFEFEDKVPGNNAGVPKPVLGETLPPTLERRSPLTTREWEILDKASRGYRTKETGNALGISPNTVSKHRENIIRKLDAKNIVEAVSKGFELDLLEPDSRDTSESDILKLTKTEVQEIVIASRGLAPRIAGQERGVSEFTVRKHHNSVLKKFGTSTMEHVIRLAIEAGVLLHPEPGTV
jgi:DNA-binding CsgD family transcriptional regulator